LSSGFSPDRRQLRSVGSAVTALRNRRPGGIVGAPQVTGRPRRAAHRAGAGTGDVAGRVPCARNASTLTKAERAPRSRRAVDAAGIRAAAAADVVIRAIDRAAAGPADAG